jgi:hypothetical protein
MPQTLAKRSVGALKFGSLTLQPIDLSEQGLYAPGTA